MAQNIWLLTEERPKRSVVSVILERSCKELGFTGVENDLRIVPIMSPDGKFKFSYRVIGFEAEEIKEIFILPVSGYSSFVDYLVFYQDGCPEDDEDKPILIIEETKTDDKESRNTGVYQRCSKFVFTEFFYPNVKKIMLYSLQVDQKEVPTRTYIFGTRMLRTLGVEIMGKKLDESLYQPFTSIDELMDVKNNMPAPYNGVAVRMKKEGQIIYISAKLEKNGTLSHDPNIGMIAIMCSCLRYLGWSGRIIITKHGLPREGSVGNRNKFNFIAHEHRIELDGIALPIGILPEQYWKRETEREKTGTIFAHVICENLVDGMLVYENHGGCERGYFTEYSTGKGVPVVIPKYTDRAKYKAGDKTAIVYIPDLVIFDKKQNEIMNIEGKTYANRQKGIQELNNFDFFETEYVNKYYPGAKITRSLILAGSGDPSEAKRIPELTLYLHSDGSIVLGESASLLVRKAVEGLALL